MKTQAEGRAYLVLAHAKGCSPSLAGRPAGCSDSEAGQKVYFLSPCSLPALLLPGPAQL